MIGNHDVAGFPIESKEGGGACGVFGLLASKDKVDREALERYSSSPSGVVSRSTLFQFGREANGTLIKDRVNVFEGRDAIYMMVCVVQIGITGVSKALMP